jgi:hypothetical protein
VPLLAPPVPAPGPWPELPAELEPPLPVTSFGSSAPLEEQAPESAALKSPTTRSGTLRIFIEGGRPVGGRPGQLELLFSEGGII